MCALCVCVCVGNGEGKTEGLQNVLEQVGDAEEEEHEAAQPICQRHKVFMFQFLHFPVLFWNVTYTTLHLIISLRVSYCH